LQEQIITKDIPFLSKLFPEPIKAEVAKGRGRYFCPMKAEATKRDNKTMSLFDNMDDSDINMSDAITIKARSLLKEFDDGRWNGDMDNLPTPASSELIGAVTTNTAACRKRSCSYYNNCPFYNAQKRLKKADIVVTNHDLLLCDIHAGGGILLPCAPNNTFYLIDEAHQFPDKAVRQLGAKFSIHGLLERTSFIGRAINKMLRTHTSIPDVK